jgi:hypothetical protein
LVPEPEIERFGAALLEQLRQFGLIVAREHRDWTGIPTERTQLPFIRWEIADRYAGVVLQDLDRVLEEQVANVGKVGTVEQVGRARAPQPSASSYWRLHFTSSPLITIRLDRDVRDFLVAAVTRQGERCATTCFGSTASRRSRKAAMSDQPEGLRMARYVNTGVWFWLLASDVLSPVRTGGDFWSAKVAQACESLHIRVGVHDRRDCRFPRPLVRR